MSYAFDLTVKALRNEGLSEKDIVEILESLSIELANMSVNDKFLNGNIKNVLNQIYMPTHLAGYTYWIDAIRICKKNGKLKMMNLYKQVAEINRTTVTRVERAMRFAKVSAFLACPLKITKEFLGKDVLSQKDDFGIQNSEFLTILLEKV